MVGLASILEPKIMAEINSSTRATLMSREVRTSNSFVLEWEDDESVIRLIQDELFARMRRGVKINGIALKLGMNHQTISRIAYGETKAPRSATVIKLLRFLGYKVKVHHG